MAAGGSADRWTVRRMGRRPGRVPACAASCVPAGLNAWPRPGSFAVSPDAQKACERPGRCLGQLHKQLSCFIGEETVAVAPCFEVIGPLQGMAPSGGTKKPQQQPPGWEAVELGDLSGTGAIAAGCLRTDFNVIDAQQGA